MPASLLAWHAMTDIPIGPVAPADSTAFSLPAPADSAFSPNYALVPHQPIRPLSNDPSVWGTLEKYIYYSPTLQQQLSRLRQLNWVYKWNYGLGSQCIPGQRTIEVDLTSAEGFVAQTVAHESSHAFDAPVHFVNFPDEYSFLQATMRNEAVAVVTQLLVREEVWRNAGVDIGIGFAYPQYYSAAIDFYRKHHCYDRLLNHITQMYVWQGVSAKNTCYLQNFVNAYRRFRRLPPIAVSAADVATGQAQAMQRLQWEMQRA